MQQASLLAGSRRCQRPHLIRSARARGRTVSPRIELMYALSLCEDRRNVVEASGLADLNIRRAGWTKTSRRCCGHSGRCVSLWAVPDHDRSASLMHQTGVEPFVVARTPAARSSVGFLSRGRSRRDLLAVMDELEMGSRRRLRHHTFSAFRCLKRSSVSTRLDGKSGPTTAR
jgi:hypothetical protein